MEACTVSNIRTILIFTVVVMALFGLWNFHGKVTCAASADARRCTTKAFGISTAVLGGAFLLITLYMVNEANKAATASAAPSTTDLLENLA
jgi:hypothetical protein